MDRMIRRYLVVSADGSARVQTRPRYAAGTRTFALNIRIPSPRTIAGEYTVEAPAAEDPILGEATDA
jgi:hypothetical protein